MKNLNKIHEKLKVYNVELHLTYAETSGKEHITASMWLLTQKILNSVNNPIYSIVWLSQKKSKVGLVHMRGPC